MIRSLHSESEFDELREDARRLRKALAAATMDLAAVLRLRGFRVHSMEPSEDLLLPGTGHR